MPLIVITGASQGIGAEIALRFSKEKETTLMLLARSEDKLNNIAAQCRKSGATVQCFVCDVTDESNVNNVASAILQQWGSPDVLINNAGFYQESRFSDCTQDQFKAQIDVNLTGPFLVTQTFFSAMMSKECSDVFFICSMASIQGYSQSIAYCAAKHGLLGLSRSLREEAKNTGMRVTAILPGPTLTPSWANTTISEDHFIPPMDIANLVVDIHHLDRHTNIDELIVNPRNLAGGN